MEVIEVGFIVPALLHVFSLSFKSYLSLSRLILFWPISIFFYLTF